MLHAIAKLGQHLSGTSSGFWSPVKSTISSLVTFVRTVIRVCVSVPIRWMLWPLYLSEPLLRPILPVTAGQLTGFICDSCCDPQLEDQSFVPRHDLASMVERTISAG